MAKKKANKITAEELAKVQGLVEAMNQAQSQLGGLELQKADVLAQYDGMRETMQKLQAELREAYGNVNIDLSDGSYEETDASNS